MNNKSGLIYDGEKFSKQGEPTEAALKVAAEKLGQYDSKVHMDFNKSSTPYTQHLSQGIIRIASLDFTSERKTMSTVVKGYNGGHNTLLLKGAPERVIAKSDTYKNAKGDIVKLNPADREKLIADVHKFAS